MRKLELTYVEIIKADKKQRKEDRARMWKEFNYLCRVLANRAEFGEKGGKPKKGKGKGKGKGPNWVSG